MNKLDAQIPLVRDEEVDSTSRRARRAVLSGGLRGPTLFIATRQTRGMGRFGRTWESPPGGLWCTLAWPAAMSPTGVLDGLGLRLGLACARVIEHELAAHGKGPTVELKWPNDVLINGRKVLGLLAEVFTRGGETFILVGVGVNADFPASELPAELRNSAATLRDVIGGPVNLTRLIDDLRRRLREALMRSGLDEATLDAVRERLHGVGAPTTITLPDGSRRTGTLDGLDDNGRLLLTTPDGRWTAPPGAELAGAPPAS